MNQTNSANKVLSLRIFVLNSSSMGKTLNSDFHQSDLILSRSKVKYSIFWSCLGSRSKFKCIWVKVGGRNEIHPQ